MGGDKGSGSGALKTYDYYGTIAAAICEGPIDAVHALIVDNKEVWPKAKAWALGETGIAQDSLRTAGGRTWKARVAHDATADNAPPNATHWELYALPPDGSGCASFTAVGYGEVRVWCGTQTQTVDPLLQPGGNDKGQDHPDYRGIAYIVLSNFLLGRERVTAPNVEIVVSRKPMQTVVTDGGGRTPASLVDGQANVVAAEVELLTSENALGQPVAALADATFQAVASKLDERADLTACSVLVDSQMTLRGIADQFAAMTDTFLRFNPITGLVECVQWVHGQTPASFHTLTVNDLVNRPKFTAQGWSSMKTGAVIIFHDRERGYKESSDKLDDLRAFRVIGEHRREQIDRPYITRRTQALAHAAETLRTVGRPQLEAKITVRREKARTIRVGDWVKLDIDLEPGGTQLLQYFRVTERELPFTGPVELTLDADETLAPVPYVAGQPLPVSADEQVPAIAHARIIEAPPAIAQEDDVLVALIERPNRIVCGARVWLDEAEDGDFQIVAGVANFAARATLRSDIAADATTIPIAVPAQSDVARFESDPGAVQARDDTLLAFLVKVSGGQVATDAAGYAYVEACSVSAQEMAAAGQYDLTVTRARQGTGAKAFAVADTEVWVIPRSVLVPFTHSFLAASRGVLPVWFRLQPFTYVASRDDDDCAAFSVTLATNAARRPVLALTAPASWSITVADAFPAAVAVTGAWTDTNGDIVNVKMVLRNNSESITVNDSFFAPTGSVPVSETVLIPSNGLWYIDMIATDLSGLKTTRTIEVNATNGGGGVCAMPVVRVGGRVLSSGGYYSGPLGEAEITCATPGASIVWRKRMLLSDAVTQRKTWTGWYGLPMAFTINWDGTIASTCIQYEIVATRAGFSNSPTVTLYCHPNAWP